jgi:hypothetical protein
VDNTIGLNNYKFFYLFLLFVTLTLFSFAITLTMYLRRYTSEHGMPWLTLLLGLELCVCLFPAGGMLLYHTQLSMLNLSTNEHLHVKKYKYLYPTVNGKRKYRNPWFKGRFQNMMDRMQPSERCYTIPADLQALTKQTSGDMV